MDSYKPGEALYALKIASSLGIPEDQKALAIAKSCGREAEMFEEVARSSSGPVCLQTILDTEDDAKTIIQTLEFVSGTVGLGPGCDVSPFYYFSRFRGVRVSPR